ncbi:hypothetical protein C5167_015278 [Papaver somniferum]|uniref:Uncharacterized protein n=1 Tax=Papaver somniferum TaxID=3469 RepID=A0A4Y7J6G6_PAPSO|nr:hypothetical protein C5167_015278 [Papaver somniferum]
MRSFSCLTYGSCSKGPHPQHSTKMERSYAGRPRTVRKRVTMLPSVGKVAIFRSSDSPPSGSDGGQIFLRARPREPSRIRNLCYDRMLLCTKVQKLHNKGSASW